MKYINGKIDIWCGDSAPSNTNIIWMKRVTQDDNDLFDLFWYNVNSGEWISFLTQPSYESTFIISE